MALNPTFSFLSHYTSVITLFYFLGILAHNLQTFGSFYPSDWHVELSLYYVPVRILFRSQINQTCHRRVGFKLIGQISGCPLTELDNKKWGHSNACGYCPFSPLPKEAHPPCFVCCLSLVHRNSHNFELGRKLLVRFRFGERKFFLRIWNPIHILQSSFSKKFHWRLQALAQLKLKWNFDFSFIIVHWAYNCLGSLKKNR